VLETYFAKQDKRPLPSLAVGSDGLIKTVASPPPVSRPAPAAVPARDAG